MDFRTRKTQQEEILSSSKKNKLQYNKPKNPIPSEWSYRSKDMFKPITYKMISPEIQARIDEIRSIPSLRK
jgi:hypothetical protein